MLCISQFSPACKIGSVNKVKLSKICANCKKDWASEIFNKNLEFLLCQNRLLLCPICPDSSRCPGECIYIGNQYYVNISNYEDQLDIQWPQTTQWWIGLFRRFTLRLNMELYDFLPKGRHKKLFFVLSVKRGGGLGQSKKSSSENTQIFFDHLWPKAEFFWTFLTKNCVFLPFFH